MINPRAAIGRIWIESWNSRDLERILALYDDDIELSSWGILTLGINDEGRVRGKNALRAYWGAALAARPELHFELIEVSSSPDSLIVRYQNDRGATVSEYLRLNADGLIVQGSANHATG